MRDLPKFDLDEIQRRMDSNPIVNPEVARQEKVRLEKEAEREAERVEVQNTINGLKRLLA